MATGLAFPIDVVYTWVDGSEKNHQETCQLYLKKEAKLHTTISVPFGGLIGINYAIH